MKKLSTSDIGIEDGRISRMNNTPQSYLPLIADGLQSFPGGSAPPEIGGLNYFSSYISESEEVVLLAAIDSEYWLDDLKRRVQHYGFRYDYKSRKVDSTMYLGSLPSWACSIAERLVANGHMTVQPNQLIVNEYLPGQGISAHVDCIPCFGPTLSSLSLNSSCLMDLTSLKGTDKVSILLNPRSLLVLGGSARYQWKHAIAARKSDRVDGSILQRGRRVSLTFRNVIQDSN